MNTTKMLILAGAAALIVGVCLPVANDHTGGWSLLRVGDSRAVGWVFVGALAAGGFALADRVRYAVWPALATFAGLVFAFIGLKSEMDRINEREPAETAAYLHWLGWAVLAVGVILVMVASFRVLTDPDEPDEA